MKRISRKEFIYKSGVGLVALPSLLLTSCDKEEVPKNEPKPGNLDCYVTPEQTADPFYINTNLKRVDITEGKPGLPFRLNFTIVDGQTCEPLNGIILSVWHCDAEGIFSMYDDTMQAKDASDETFLRGFQISDNEGKVTFDTIFPGWYPGRVTHIFFEIQLESGKTAFTSQLYFDAGVTQEIYTTEEPYIERGNNLIDFSQDPVLKLQLFEPDAINQLTINVTEREGLLNGDYRIGLTL